MVNLPLLSNAWPADSLSKMGAMAATEGAITSGVDDWLRGNELNWKRAILSGLAGATLFGFASGAYPLVQPLINKATATIEKHAGPVVAKINKLPIPTLEVLEAPGVGKVPNSKTVGDTPFGAWLQKFASNGGSKGTPKKTSYVSLSKSDIKHFSKHIVFNFSKQVPYLSDDVLKAKLEKNSFFNPKWSTEKIISEVEKGYNEAIQKGITGEYIFNSDGEQITIFIHSDGQFATAYGSHKLNLSYFGR
ncbi:hypothetical protein [Laceyella tengchongensis]|uniref:hypothetical protein n=1 Tax=Laceyella tengchongensis TaxID=574699 RepID=UPI0012B9B687|nr:hypothetical protein [Laceyella tengchongensis]